MYVWPPLLNDNDTVISAHAASLVPVRASHSHVQTQGGRNWGRQRRLLL